MDKIVNNIVFLGPEGTFSHQAALKIFPAAKTCPAPTISKVFETVLNDGADFGVVPAENSTEGIVQETLDNLAKHPLKIIGSYNMPIRLCLLGRTDDLAVIKTIKSHPQPLAQSRNWLSKNFPNAEIEIEASSTKAILGTKDPAIAFVASENAAEKYGLKILAKNIQDKKTNVTQFYVLSKKDSSELSRELKPAKTFLLLAVYDRPAVLRDILNYFADENINLSKLHSRVSEAEGWDYYFFLEVESLPDERLKKVLENIKEYCSKIKILGTT